MRRPHAAAEVQLQYYDEFGLDLRSAFGSQSVATSTASPRPANVKWFPFTGRVQPYVAGGLGFLVLRVEAQCAGRARRWSDFRMIPVTAGAQYRF